MTNFCTEGRIYIACTGLIAGKPAPTGYPQFSRPAPYLWELVAGDEALKESTQLKQCTLLVHRYQNSHL
ncbi:hypothetical protein, partial [Pseudomonas asiatica]|uniref:hypothetical protein n=1 Tax=Pseudomonas asiatica TaxID=2219225 RepID=UPI001F280238